MYHLLAGIVSVVIRLLCCTSLSIALHPSCARLHVYCSKLSCGQNSLCANILRFLLFCNNRVLTVVYLRLLLATDCIVQLLGCKVQVYKIHFICSIGYVFSSLLRMGLYSVQCHCFPRL